MNLTIAELEHIINLWRQSCPASSEERTLSKEVNLLATLYAQMITHHLAIISLNTLHPAIHQLIEPYLKYYPARS